MAAVPPAAAPLRPIENIFGIVHDTLINFMVREGTHEALHALVDLERGAIGLHTMGVIRTGMTAAVRALAQSVYIPNHHPSHAAVLAVPGGPVALPGPGPASPAWDEIMDAGCVQCFHFLGYMLHAAENNPVSKPIMAYIAAKIPLADYTVPQSLTDPTLTTFVVGLMEEPSMWATVRRIAALPPALHPGNDLSTWVDDHHFLEMGPWINVTAANALLRLNIHVGRGTHAGHTIWGSVIASQNPHRGSMLQWLYNHPAPVTALNPTGSLINSLSNAPGLDPPLPGNWPPWGIAMALGDRTSATILTRMAGLNTVARGIGIPGIRGTMTAAGISYVRQLGCAAVYFLEEHNVAMLRHWLVHAPVSKGAVLSVLVFILDRLAEARGDIDATPMPVGYAGTIQAWTREKSQQKKRKNQIAIRMIKVILSRGFRRFTASNVLDRRMPTVMREMMEDPRYQQFLVLIRIDQAYGLYPGMADVILQLDGRSRNTRSGRHLDLDD